VTFDAILDATARILEDLGYAALTTNGVAGVAGVAVGSVYEYFSNKESIVAELARRTVRRILHEVEAAFDEVAGMESRDEAIETLVRRCMDVLRRHSTQLRVFTEDAPFVWNLDEVKDFRTKLFEIAWRSRAVAKNGILEGNRHAMGYLHLLIPIGRWVPYAAVIDRPPWLSPEAADDAVVEIFRRLLA
jgi:AcrR family transcriptional regulator